MLKQKSENVDKIIRLFANFTHLNLQADSSRETNQYQIVFPNFPFANISVTSISLSQHF